MAYTKGVCPTTGTVVIGYLDGETAHCATCGAELDDVPADAPSGAST